MVGAPPAGQYTQTAAQALVDDKKKRIADTFANAFMVHFLPAQLQSEVLEQKPETIADILQTTSDYLQHLKDVKTPLGL